MKKCVGNVLQIDKTVKASRTPRKARSEDYPRGMANALRYHEDLFRLPNYPTALVGIDKVKTTVISPCSDPSCTYPFVELVRMIDRFILSDKVRRLG